MKSRTESSDFPTKVLNSKAEECCVSSTIQKCDEPVMVTTAQQTEPRATQQRRQRSKSQKSDTNVYEKKTVLTKNNFNRKGTKEGLRQFKNDGHKIRQNWRNQRNNRTTVQKAPHRTRVLKNPQNIFGYERMLTRLYYACLDPRMTKSYFDFLLQMWRNYFWSAPYQ